MDYGLTTATWLWLLIPMPAVVILSCIHYYAEKGEDL